MVQRYILWGITLKTDCCVTMKRLPRQAHDSKVYQIGRNYGKLLSPGDRLKSGTLYGDQLGVDSNGCQGEH